MDIKQAFTELGLTPQSNQAEAKAAYRALAMRWHPDVNAGVQTDSRMKLINVAYALVCQYLDTLAHKPPSKSASAPAAPSGFQEFDWHTGFTSASQVRSTPQQDCVQRTVRVSLFEAAFGCVKGINGSVREACTRCTGRGLFQAAAPQCPTCKGTGKTERYAWMVEVPIHAGTLDGTVVQAADIRVRAGAEALPRNFRLTIQIEKHPLFRLDQNRLSVTVPISVWRWAMGGEITVPTLEGTARVRLPSKPAVLLVKNQGWPEPGMPQRRKPLFVMPKIVYPEQLRDEDRRMLQVLDVRSHMPEVQGWSRHVQAWMET